MRKIVVAGIMAIALSGSCVSAAERVSLGYIYSTSKSHTEIVAATQGGVNVVSPTCFDLTMKGHLDIKEIMDENFVSNMHEQGIKVTPFLSNHWGQKRAQAALKNADILIPEIIAAIEKYDFDGVNVDLENLKASDRDSLTEFMRKLREAMPEEKTVSIAVAPNPEKTTNTWLAAYDYENLAKHADYLVVMAYDEHCYGGAEGPVASIGYVEKSLTSILEVVSKDKIVLGLPMYGRFWEVGAPTGGEAIINAQAPRIIKQFKVVPNYIEKEGTPMMQVKVKEGQKGPYVNGRYLDAGTYNIWYENERSIKEKLALINKYDILGSALWALDNEDVSMWNYYKDCLNEIPYESTEEIEIRMKMDYIMQYIVEEARGVKLVAEEIRNYIAYKYNNIPQKVYSLSKININAFVKHALIPSYSHHYIKVEKKYAC